MLKKSTYSAELHLDLDEHCMLQPPVFTTCDELWNHYGNQLQELEGCQLVRGETGTASSGPRSPVELGHLSSRSYSVRVSDPNDFASVWESTVVPLITELLHKYGTSSFAVDVHNFPEMSGEAVPRVVYATLPVPLDPAAQQDIRTELGRAVPSRFNPIFLKFRSGSVRKSSWWGEEQGDKDDVCEPRNITYRPTPSIGMSIGPSRIRDAASLGGFIKVGNQQYAMSAFHAFEGCTKSGNLRVNHPAEPDIEMNRFQNSQAKSYGVGAVTMYAPPGRLRPSLTFRDTNFPVDRTLIEMDWCLIGPIENGKNIVSVPTFKMDRHVTVKTTADVRGNTEVYALARTSGYSLGFTSDVPGIQKIHGAYRREWTVRQYSPSQDSADNRSDLRWQSLRQWVTSGIGVSGDSGAWLMRRSDNTAMGLIWGRNHDRGHPMGRARLTYFTPIVDILADVQQNHAEGEHVSLPICSIETLPWNTEAHSQLVAGQGHLSQGPWNVIDSESIRRHRKEAQGLIMQDFGGENVPRSGMFLCRQQQAVSCDGATGSASSAARSQMASHFSRSAAAPDFHKRSRGEDVASVSTLDSRERLLLGPSSQSRFSSPIPELCTSSSSKGSDSDSMRGFADVINSAYNVVRIAGDEDAGEHIVEAEEPVRSKASPGVVFPGFSCSA
ncbi:hypothetical protein B0T25DRAFT_513360 [Lasiosphaeria hispida]|uniref:Uncharacterized protein n=1 Tax=Lasiosphaeria hispida TaxID=260671 RepID=A0AAJ0MK06_9PEZI|nr:hypothetical protein B0T25DRAFT_513360 [Lasiosphaeria hispida]